MTEILGLLRPILPTNVVFPEIKKKHDCRVVLNGENVATLASVIFSILAGTASKHLYRDESSGDVDLPIPSQRFPSRTILTCAFRRNQSHRRL